MSVSASQVKELRERTGAGMMDCKRALSETDGDLERAVSVLREKGLAGAAKKAGRVAAEGLVGVYTSEDARTAVIVELNCETDFVAKNEAFVALLADVGKALLASATAEVGTGEDVADLSMADGRTLSACLTEAVATVGENISLRRFERLRCEDGLLGSYVHAGGKIGVVVELRGAGSEQTELLRSLAMQIAAAFPRYVRRDEVPADEIEKESEIFRAQALASGKPDKVVERIVSGKIEKFYGEACLLEQDYVRDPDVTIEQLLGAASKDAGKELRLERFSRFQLGEGIEKRESNLAEEVAAQIAQG